MRAGSAGPLHLLAGIGERAPDQRPARHAFNPGNLPRRPAFPAEQGRRAFGRSPVASRESLRRPWLRPHDLTLLPQSLDTSEHFADRGDGRAAGPAGTAGAGAGADSGSGSGQAQAQLRCLLSRSGELRFRFRHGLRLPVDDRLQPPGLAPGHDRRRRSGWAAPMRGGPDRGSG